MSSNLFNCVIYCVNHLLKSKVNVLRTRARVLSYELEVHEAAHGLAILSNPLSSKMGAIGCLLTDEGEDKILSFDCFLINVKKYQWAIAEGFSDHEIYDPKKGIKQEIFQKVTFDSLADRLR